MVKRGKFLTNLRSKLKSKNKCNTTGLLPIGVVRIANRRINLRISATKFSLFLEIAR